MVWSGRSIQIAIVHEVDSRPSWVGALDRVPGLGRLDLGVSISRLGSAEVPRVLILHGSYCWIRGWLWRAPQKLLQAAVLVVLEPWRSDRAAHLLRQAADDAVGPQIGDEELCARLHAILRRCPAGGHEPVGLRNAERRLLDYFLASPGRLIGHDELMENVFGGTQTPGTSLVRVQVARLRKHIGKGATLRTVRGGGYVLEVDGFTNNDVDREFASHGRGR